MFESQEEYDYAMQCEAEAEAENAARAAEAEAEQQRIENDVFEENIKLKQRNQALKDALIFIAKEQIKKFDNKIKFINEKREPMTKGELTEYYQTEKAKWETALQSYINL